MVRLPVDVNGVAVAVSDCGKQLWANHKIAVIGTAAFAAAIYAHREIKRYRLKQKWDSVGKNVVVVHGLKRGTTSPNISPFVLKLETFLRMAEIKYEFDDAEPIGPKGKMPWISLNGETYADSQHIIEFLGNKFNKDFTSALTSEQKAVARAMQVMTDEHLFWGLPWWRFCKDPDMRLFDMTKFPLYVRLLLPVLRARMSKALWFQGLGRHSDAEIEETIRKDIQALSLYLSDKAFLMGPSPCQVDCSVFAVVSQFVWAMPGSPFASMVQNDYRNLLHYCVRMREKFWPDWDKLLDEV